MTVSSVRGPVDPYTVDDRERLRDAIRAGEIPIAVYGLGKVGLPIAAVYARASGNVIGVDIDESVVEAVNAGRPPFDHEPGLATLLQDHSTNGTLQATSDGRSAAQNARVHIIIVPVPRQDGRREPPAPSWTPEGGIENDGRPDVHADLSALEAALEDVAAGLKEGDLVVVESTVPPGTTEGIVSDILERESDLDGGDFGVAFSPERVSSGRAIRDVMGAYPKVVGGIDDESTKAAASVYEAVTSADVVRVSDSTTAEAVKLFEGVYRDVNIGLANELGRMTDELGIDVLEAIDVANDNPYCDIHDPGAGVGGHCIPNYPHYLMEAVQEAPIIETARQVNESMPLFVVDTLVDSLRSRGTTMSEASIAILGLTYRPGIPETSMSPAGPIIDAIKDTGASVVGVDPVLKGAAEFDVPLVPIEALADRDLDALVLVTDHDEFGELPFDAFDDLVIVDGRDAIPETKHRTYTIGRGYR